MIMKLADIRCGTHDNEISGCDIFCFGFSFIFCWLFFKFNFKSLLIYMYENDWKKEF